MCLFHRPICLLVFFFFCLLSQERASRKNPERGQVGLSFEFVFRFHTQSWSVSIAFSRGTEASALRTAFPASASSLWVVSLLKKAFDLLCASTIVTAEARILPGTDVDLARSYLQICQLQFKNKLQMKCFHLYRLDIWIKFHHFINQVTIVVIKIWVCSAYCDYNSYIMAQTLTTVKWISCCSTANEYFMRSVIGCCFEFFVQLSFT